MAQYDKLDMGKLGDITKVVSEANNVHDKILMAVEAEHSWLGRFQDVGFAIKITPKLSPEEWRKLNPLFGKAWDSAEYRYDGMRAMEMLHQAFPRHALALQWPKCTYRTRADRRDAPPLYAVCNAQARHTEVKAVDVTGARVGIARCDEHKGQL